MGSEFLRRARRPRLLSEAAALADSLKTLAEGHPEGNDPLSRDEVRDGPTSDLPRPATPRPIAGWYLHLGRPIVAALAFLLLTSVLVLSIDGAQATTTSFTQGVNGFTSTVDTFVDGDNADQNLGTNGNADLVSTDPEHGLIRFENIVGSGPDQIPSGSTVTGATLTLYNASNPSASGATLSLHRMLTTWDDTSTFNSLGLGVQIDDVEAAATPDASTSTNVDVSDAAVTFSGLETAVQAWVDGNQNFGWSVFLNDANSWSFHTSEASNVSLRPTLAVTYDAPNPSTVVVNSTGDNPDDNIGDDVCDTGGTVGADPECTLRAAIQEANASGLVDTVNFNIPQSDAQYSPSPERFTIRPSSLLPEISTPMIIDGSTQPEFATHNRPVIEVDGNNVSAGEENGLWITGGGTTIRSLAVNRWGDDAIDIEFNGGNTLVGNHVGTDVTGTVARPNVWGINIKTTGNTVGGTAAADANVVSGNSDDGFYLYRSAGTGNTIQGNLIGTDPTGTLDVGNGGHGIYVHDSAHDNLIGGTAGGAANVIAFNSGDGIWVADDAGSGNAIVANSIHSNSGLGIDLHLSGVNANDGGDGDSGANDRLNFPVVTSATEAAGTVTVDFDLDVPNGNYRVEFFTNTAADGSGNGEGETFVDSIDVSVTGGVPTPGSYAFTGSAGDIVSATATEGAGAPFGSTSEFSAAYTVTGALSTAVVNSTGDASDQTPGNDVCDTGGTVGSDPECTLRAAIQEANASAVVHTIHFDIPQTDGGYTASPVAFTIEPASTLPDITTSMTIDGSTQPEYATSGRPVVEVSGSSAGSNADGFSLTGGTSTIRGLVVNNWDDEGVALTSGGNSVFGSYIGTDVTGSAAAPNKIGVILRGAGNTVGGPGADGNLVSGNTNQGIMVTIGGSSTQIVGNLVGTDAGGNGPLPNGRGIDLNSADDGFVGGTDPSLANTVAHNTSYGVAVTGSSDGNSILGNAIHSNGGLGIDHNNDGVTSNDAGDGDTGQNDFMNYPVITSAGGSGGNVTVTFDLDVPAGTYRVEFFDNTAADGSGYGEGETFLGSVDVSAGTGLTHVVPGASGDIITATATESLGGGNYGSTSEFSAALTATASGHSEPMAIWRRSGLSTPFYSTWDGSTFGGTQASSGVGDFRIMQGAESPTRDEAIVVGVASGGTIAGEMWDGSSWTALPTLGTNGQDYWWSLDVAYEPVSGDAIIVYTDGSALNYRVWDGSTWSAEAPIPESAGGTPRQLQLAAHPFSDEMVLIVSNDSSQDYAVVWDGSTWGNQITLDATGTGNDRTDVHVAYEQQSGRALAVWGSGNDDVHFRVWDAGWSNEFVTPGIGSGYARWITLDADPNSDHIAMGVLTNDADVWLAVWNGAGWIDQTTATTGSTGTDHPAVAIGFEGTSGEAIATYGESSNTPRFRTWTSGSGWDAEQSAPDIGAQPNSQMLYPEPETDGVMLAVNDDSNDVHYLYWNGSSWGTDHELETSSGEVKNQPFLFLWNAATARSPAPGRSRR